MKTIATEQATQTTLIVPPSASREVRIRLLLDYIDAVKDIPMEPTEYVSHWVRYPLDVRGYRRVCDEVLAAAVGVRTISWGKNYGRRPACIPMILRLADIVKRIREYGICRAEDTKCWEKSIPLPRSWPSPLFKFEDKVIHEKTGAFGTVMGLEYLSKQAAWGYSVLLHPSSPFQPGKRVWFGESELSWW